MIGTLNVEPLPQSMDFALAHFGLRSLKKDAAVCEQFISTANRITAFSRTGSIALNGLIEDLRCFDANDLACGYIAQLIQIGIANRQLLAGVQREINRMGIDRLVADLRTNPHAVLRIVGVSAAREEMKRYARDTNLALIAAKLALMDPLNDPETIGKLMDISQRIRDAQEAEVRRMQDERAREAEAEAKSNRIPYLLDIIIWVVVIVTIIMMIIATGPNWAQAQQRRAIDPITRALSDRLHRAEGIAAACTCDTKLKYDECLRQATSPRQIQVCTAKYLARLARDCRVAL